MPDHLLIITDRPCTECDDGSCEACLAEGPEYDWSVVCPGVGDGCMSFQECGACPSFGDDYDAAEEWDEDMYENPEAHGVEHHKCLGEWMVPTGQCWVQVCDYTADAVSDLAGVKDGKWQRLPAGTYPIEFDVIDEECIELSLKDAA